MLRHNFSQSLFFLPLFVADPAYAIALALVGAGAL
jgi:hypothetical protein